MKGAILGVEMMAVTLLHIKMSFDQLLGLIEWLAK
jgi:hypothetical protein